MLDDNRRKAVTAVLDFSHRASLSANLTPEPAGYPDKAAAKITLTKPSRFKTDPHPIKPSRRNHQIRA